MILKLDLESEVPIYLQLKQAVMEGIASGALASGEGLPSVRMLASDLGINMHTVNKAYQQLKQEGFILIHRQKGVVVNPEIPPADDAFREHLDEHLRPLITEALCRGLVKNEFIKMAEKIYTKFEEKE